MICFDDLERSSLPINRMGHKVREFSDIITPKGVFLGKRTDDMTPEQVVDCITGAKVKKIEYENE